MSTDEKGVVVPPEDDKGTPVPPVAPPATDPFEEAAKLLKDGTLEDKEVKIPYDRFADLNEKAKKAEFLEAKVKDLESQLEGSSVSKEDYCP